MFNWLETILKSYFKKNLSSKMLYDVIKIRSMFNLILREYIKSILKGFKANPPNLVRIDVAAICNLRCQHCPTGTRYGDRKINRGLMSETVFNAIINQISQMNSVKGAIFYLSGEPLLNPNFLSFLTRIKRETKVTATAFVTNGMLLNPELCRDLAHSEVDHISISIDGRSPHENDLIRRGSRYENVKENVIMLHDALKGEKTKLIIANTIIPYEDEAYQSPTVPKFLSEDFGSQKIPTQTVHAMKWPGMTNEVISKSGFILKKNRLATNYCAMPFYNISIRYNGDIVLCCNDLVGEKVMGNILKDDILQVWNGQEYRRIRKAMATFQVMGRLPSVCSKCPAYSNVGIFIKRT